jgi:hypothetical protein
MKQALLAIMLILVPVAVFVGFEALVKKEQPATASLGDLSAFKTIVSDVQTLVSKGDMAGASRRITDYESAWDQAEAALRPLNPTYWRNIDEASDVALGATRRSNPSSETVQKSLVALMAVLNDPSRPAD